MTSKPDGLIAFPEPHWIEGEDGAWTYLSRLGDGQCSVYPTDHGLWSFASTYMRGQCETLDGAKDAAVRYLHPEDPLDGLDEDRRKLAEALLAKYQTLGPEARATFLQEISDILDIEDATVIPFASLGETGDD